MSDVTRILDAIEDGDLKAAAELFPVAYEELRRIAANKMGNERGEHTLQPTALVHEAYLRLLGPDGEQRRWNSRGHFFSAAAEAMRRILVESARKKHSLKRGGAHIRTTWDESKFAGEVPSDEIFRVDAALEKLEQVKPEFAKVVKLRYFAGLSIAEAALALDVSESSIDRAWRGARVWLFREIQQSE
jgi:RNA polymerase sigma factor (TIGR02999 family)